MNEKKVIMSRFVKDINILKTQREILSCFDEILKIGPDVEKALSHVSYQCAICGEYKKIKILNALKSMILGMSATVAGNIVAQEIIEPSTNTVFALVGATTAYLLLQLNNKAKYAENSLDQETLEEDFEVINEKLTSIHTRLTNLLQTYSDLNNFSPSAYLKVDEIINIFFKNNEYIKKQKENYDLSNSFNYFNVMEAFDDIFGIDGFSTYIEGAFKDDKDFLEKSNKLHI